MRVRVFNTAAKEACLTGLQDTTFGVQILHCKNDSRGFKQAVYPASLFHYEGIIMYKLM
jgi:hypothetical protein